MIKSKIVLLSALVSCALISGCKEENKTNVSIEFMHSSVEQERQAVISKLIARFEKENPGITVKQVPVEEAVSYTHLTLPTNREVEILADAVSLKKKTKTHLRAQDTRYMNNKQNSHHYNAHRTVQ